MLKALVWKELREQLPIVVVTLLVQALLVALAVGVDLGGLSNLLGVSGSRRTEIPFVSDLFSDWFVVVSGVCAIAIGLWQTMRESANSTYLFLLHRPIARNSVIATKLTVGTVLFLVVAVTPTLYFAVWAATPGTHASPFEWSMTLWAWEAICCVSLVYFGAFLSGLWPARWFGSRFFPLLAAIGIAFLAASYSSVFPQRFGAPMWLIKWTLLLAMVVAFVQGIFYLADTRDY